MAIFDGLRLADYNYAELVEDDLISDVNVDEKGTSILARMK